MNAKQAMKKAQKLAQQEANQKTEDVCFPEDEREKLPDIYEAKYKSKDLKTKIADLGMWSMIPCVTGGLNSANGVRRLKENDLLFSFIDAYFQDMPFAFEPNMQDGRFMFLPEAVGHQGMGICVSKELPGFLEVGHFWYPCEFTERSISGFVDQVYIPMFSSRPGPELAEMVRNVYLQTARQKTEDYCTFPFSMNLTVTLRGHFLDRIDQSAKTIKTALKDQDPQVQRNGEGLIIFMQRIMGKA